jgi:hypothetical protein
MNCSTAWLAVSLLLYLPQYFTVKMSEGIVATSYKPGDKFFIDPAKLLPLERFLPQPKGAPGAGRGGAGGRGEPAVLLLLLLRMVD